MAFSPVMQDGYEIHDFTPPCEKLVSPDSLSCRQLLGDFNKSFSKLHENSALKVNFKRMYHLDREKFYTHNIHSYPAKMIRHMVIFALSYARRRDIIFDPFCGSGTVLLESKINGRNSYGIDINPLCRLITKVKTTPINTKKLNLAAEKLFESIKYFDEDVTVPEFPNRDYWFTKSSQGNLSKIKVCIDTIKDDDDIKDFFRVCFSSIIRKVSMADPKMAPPVKSKRMKRDVLPKRKIHVINEFKKETLENIKLLSNFTFECDKNSFAEVIGDDARNVNLPDESVNMVITSPPYLDAQKYMRVMRLELFWLGLTTLKSFYEIDKNSVGTERVSIDDYGRLHHVGIDDADKIIERSYEIDPLRSYIVAKYFEDMKKAIREIYRVLKPDGKFILVIGNNTVHNKTLPNQDILRQIAVNVGFDTELILMDKIKSRGLMTKRNKTAGIINSEWVIVFKK